MDDSRGPVEGVIESWSSSDSVGRIKLASGETIRFGGTACTFLPAVGARVVVQAVENHPLGGLRARLVTLVDTEDPARLLDEAQPLRGTVASEASSAAFAEAINAAGLLGILLHRPIVSRVSLREWFAPASVPIRFDDPRAPTIRVGDVDVHLLLCARDVPAGKGFVSFASSSPFPIERERELALMSAETGGPRVDRLAALASLVQVVARCATTEVAVLAHQSIGFLEPVDRWARMPPLQQWARPFRHQDGSALFSGMRALHLPDLYGPPDTADLLADAATALVELGRRPEVDALLGRCRVTQTAYDWVRLARA